MARILLISANITEDPYPVYPLGMSMIARDVQNNGHEVFEWDILAQGTSHNELLNHVETVKPGIIGVSIRNIDNCSYDHSHSYTELYQDLINNLKTKTTCPIVLGGAGFSLFPETLLTTLKADFGVAGEGEGIFSELIEQILGGTPPKEKIVRRSIPIKGNEIAKGSRNDLFAKYYWNSGGMLNIQTKRGCPYKCAYCSYPTLEGRTYRHRPPEDVVTEVEELIKQYDLKYYFIADSVFNDSEGQYLKIVEELVRREINVPWMGYFRPQKFHADEVALLKKSGLNAVEWGTDCSTDETLESMGKGFSWSDVVESNTLFHNAGIPCAHFIIFGGPGENAQTLKKGLENISALEKCVVFASAGVRVIPETRMHKQAIKDGLITLEQDLLTPFFYFSPSITPEYLHNAITESFLNRMDRIYPLSRDNEKVKAFHKLGYRGPIWDLLLGRAKSRPRRKRVKRVEPC